MPGRVRAAGRCLSRTRRPAAPRSAVRSINCCRGSRRFASTRSRTSRSPATVTSSIRRKSLPFAKATGKLDFARDCIAIAGVFTDSASALENKHPFTEAELTPLGDGGESLREQLTPGGAPRRPKDRDPVAILRDKFAMDVEAGYAILEKAAVVKWGVAALRRHVAPLLSRTRVAKSAPTPTDPEPEESPVGLAVVLYRDEPPVLRSNGPSNAALFSTIAVGVALFGCGEAAAFAPILARRRASRTSTRAAHASIAAAFRASHSLVQRRSRLAPPSRWSDPLRVFLASSLGSSAASYFFLAVIFLLFIAIRRARRVLKTRGLEQKKRMQAALAAAATAIGAEVRELLPDELTASARGFVFTLRLVWSERTPARTIIRIETPPFDLLLDLVKEARVTHKRRAEHVDITTGDEPFDAAWSVEGAPKARIKRLLADRPLRHRLRRAADQRGAEIGIESGAIRFNCLGLDYADGVVSTENLELTLDLASAVMAENALPSPDAEVIEGDYRTAPLDDRTDDRAEIEELEELREARAQR